MTRINIGVHPHELCDQHLIAEYRELPRIFNMPRPKRIPMGFCLGTGHVSFCWAIQGELAERQRQLIEEMQYRGFRTSYDKVWEPLQNRGLLHIQEWVRASRIVRERISERLPKQPRWTSRFAPDWIRNNTPSHVEIIYEIVD